MNTQIKNILKEDGKINAIEMARILRKSESDFFTRMGQVLCGLGTRSEASYKAVYDGLAKHPNVSIDVYGYSLDRRAASLMLMSYDWSYMTKVYDLFIDAAAMIEEQDAEIDSLINVLSELTGAIDEEEELNNYHLKLNTK